jgi:hypothetical protein
MENKINVKLKKLLEGALQGGEGVLATPPLHQLAVFRVIEAA